MDRLLIATAEQKEGERYGGERYGDQRSEGSAKTLGCFGCHHDLRLSALIANALHRIEVRAERGMEGKVLILAAVPTCHGGGRNFSYLIEAEAFVKPPAQPDAPALQQAAFLPRAAAGPSIAR